MRIHKVNHIYIMQVLFKELKLILKSKQTNTWTLALMAPMAGMFEK